jgi:hypothetical protein
VQFGLIAAQMGLTETKKQHFKNSSQYLAPRSFMVAAALAMAAYAAVQGHTESSYRIDPNVWDCDWQGLRTNLYLRSGWTIILPGGYRY